MLKTFHIHIKGIVQGVGFRPFVYKCALAKGFKGRVNNTNDGVHIHINASREAATDFLKYLLQHLPPLAQVTAYELKEVPFVQFKDFRIVKSDNNTPPNLLLTPDVALCEDCRKELHDAGNRRYKYPFITCTNCGPRYSIIHTLPYDRPHTTMAGFQMCKTCEEEYHNPLERRHFSQTNSCAACKIEMQWYEKGNMTENFTDLDKVIAYWNAGKIIAIKGIGGYLLTCDATQAEAVARLRKRKKRPEKPFALMYPGIEMIRRDTYLNDVEVKELESIAAPIVLLRPKENLQNSIALQAVNSGLARVGVMLPYTPLYDLLLQKMQKPIVATSGNITDSGIIYTDEKALEELSGIADIMLLNNREIVIPQDDGVVQFTQKNNQKIVLRRSRGKAPAYINKDMEISSKSVFAAGSMLKSTFGITHQKNTYISQYLGNTASYDAQQIYEATFAHFKRLFTLQFDAVVVDKHPDYFATGFGKTLAGKQAAEIFELQHHKAHFYAVLGEWNLLNSGAKILGVIWDGTGLGDDGNIWGGEFFTYQNNLMARVGHTGSFPFILGDKMVKEPRISALAIGHAVKGIEKLVREKFTPVEYRIYQKLLQKAPLKSTSMGRLFDAVSSLVLACDIHRFEAEASMRLEQAAGTYYYTHTMTLEDSYLEKELPGNISFFILESVVNDLLAQREKNRIAARFHISLVDVIMRVAKTNNIRKLAFSGGVFQNALLVDMLFDFLKKDYHLYFHKEFSPNDEGIPFGQLVYANMEF